MQLKKLAFNILSIVKKQSLLSVCFFLIFLFFLYTRLTNLQYRIPFSWDQIQFSEQIWGIVRNHDFVLLGPRVNNDLGFYLAPYFTYVLIPFYFLTNLHPNALIVFVILMHFTIIVGITYAFTRLWSAKHAIIVLALWLINYHTQLNDINPWWPIMIPIGTIITLLMIKIIYENPDRNFNWILFGLLQGFFFHMHFQYILMIGFTLIAIFLIKRRKKCTWRGSGLFLITFIITFIPLILFDFRHNFLNFKLFIDFFFGSGSSDKNYLSFIPVLNNFFHPYTIVKSTLLSSLILILTILGGFYLFKNSKGFKQIIYFSAVLTIVFMLILFSAYGKRPSEYYFLFSLPLFLMIVAELTLQFKLSSILVMVIVFMAIINYPTYQNNIRINPQSLFFMDKTVLYLEKNIGKTGYRLSFSDDNIASGFSYLFRQKGFKLETDTKSHSFVHISIPPDKKLTTKIIGNYGVYISKNLVR